MTWRACVALAGPLATVLGASCDARPPATDPGLVERTDSAGIEIVRNLGGDRPLAWTFERVFQLGGAEEGPEQFSMLNEWMVEADARGRIYVLDFANFRVAVFDSAGTHLRSFGGKGQGPGELDTPMGLSVSADGTVTVADLAREALSRWDSAGNPLPSGNGLRFIAQTSKPFAVMENDLVAVTQRPGPTEGTATWRLVRTDSNSRDTVGLAEVAVPWPALVDDGCVMGWNPPVFTPDLIWDADQQRIAVSVGVGYDILLVRGSDRLRLRRDLPVREATREMALEELSGGTVTMAMLTMPCSTPAEIRVDRRSISPVLPGIAGIALSPDGSIWVRRGAVRSEPHLIDIFDANGVYQGTPPPDSPFPVAFMPAGDPLVIERDDNDIDRVVLYRIDRGGSETRGLLNQ